MDETAPARVAASGDVAVGATHCVTHHGHEVLLCRTADGLYAVDDRCTHGAARLSEGRLKGNRLVCPLHGGAFDVRDGRAVNRPATTSLPTYPVYEVDGAIVLGPRPNDG